MYSLEVILTSEDTQGRISLLLDWRIFIMDLQWNLVNSDTVNQEQIPHITARIPMCILFVEM